MTKRMWRLNIHLYIRLSKEIFYCSDHNGDRDTIIIMELKQWSEVELVEGKEAIVRAVINSGVREVAHPSYQAWSYAALIEDYNENVQTQDIQLKPCAYLHNYRKPGHQEDPLTQSSYQYYIVDEARRLNEKSGKYQNPGEH